MNGFQWQCPKSRFTKTEIRALEKYGEIFLALTDGTQAAKSEGERQFVRVAHNQAEPKSRWERLWRKYLNRVRHYETARDRVGAAQSAGVSEA